MTPTEKAVEAAARAIWAKRGGIPRLFYEPARLGSNLAKQQFQCWEYARAALTAAAPLMQQWQPISTLDIAKVAEASRVDIQTVGRVLSALQARRGGDAFSETGT